MRHSVSLAAALSLFGCGQPAARDLQGKATPTVVIKRKPSTATAVVAPSLPSLSHPRAQAEQPVDPHSVEAAAQIVRHYSQLIEHREFAAARRLWGDGPPADGLGDTEFAAAFENYATIHAAVGTAGEPEGAAGSIYVDVPLHLSGTLKTGGQFDLVGPISLRRVNGVDGATPAQLRWHIFQSGLKSTR